MTDNVKLIKELFLKLPNDGSKGVFTSAVGERFNRKPGSIKNFWLGGFWVIPMTHEKIILRMLKDTLFLKKIKY